MDEAPEYVLGHADQEVARLQMQAQVIEPFTRRLIRECGIRAGMRVLDIGCGAGDVALLLAEAVGPTGAVVALDREVRAIDTARRRAAHAGQTNIECAVGSEESLAHYPRFDAALGRYVLIHQPEPVTLIRKVSDAVKPGGVVAFQEPAHYLGTQILPAVDLWSHMFDSIVDLEKAAFKQPQAAGQLLRYFEAAGLPAPGLLWESVAGGPRSPYLRYGVTSYRVFLPLIERAGLLRPEVGDPGTLLERLVAAVTAAQAQFAGAPEAGIWAKRP